MKRHVVTVVNGVAVSQDVEMTAQEEAAQLAEWAANASAPAPTPVPQNPGQLLFRIAQLEARLNAANITPAPPSQPPGQSGQGK